MELKTEHGKGKQWNKRFYWKKNTHIREKLLFPLSSLPLFGFAVFLSDIINSTRF